MDGRLAATYSEVGGKRLSAVECIAEGSSNQHELNGVTAFRKVLGEERQTLPCRYIYFSDHDGGEVSYEEQTSTITWYDARENHPTRSEYRLVYPVEAVVMAEAREGDFCWILTSRDAARLTLVVAESSSRAAAVLDGLFNTRLRDLVVRADDRAPGARPAPVQDAHGLDLVAVEILEALHVPVDLEGGLESRIVDGLVARFGTTQMPAVREFASYCRMACALDGDASTHPDQVLTTWYDTTNAVYLAYERLILEPILKNELTSGGMDVDRFFELASSFKNRRFSRAGTTFEDHLGALFTLVGVQWEQPTKRLTDRTKPDFLMPGVRQFEDDAYPNELLTLLAAKTTAKERWAQIVSEGTRMEERHFVTMDRQLTLDSLTSMATQHIVPVVPVPVQVLYGAAPRQHFMSLADFLDMVRTKEASAVSRGLLAA